MSTRAFLRFTTNIGYPTESTIALVKTHDGNPESIAATIEEALIASYDDVLLNPVPLSNALIVADPAQYRIEKDHASPDTYYGSEFTYSFEPQNGLLTVTKGSKTLFDGSMLEFLNEYLDRYNTMVHRYHQSNPMLTEKEKTVRPVIELQHNGLSSMPPALLSFDLAKKIKAYHEKGVCKYKEHSPDGYHSNPNYTTGIDLIEKLDDLIENWEERAIELNRPGKIQESMIP